MVWVYLLAGSPRSAKFCEMTKEALIFVPTFPDWLTPVTVISGAALEELSLNGMEGFFIDSCGVGIPIMTLAGWPRSLTHPHGGSYHLCQYTYGYSIHFRGWKNS